MAQATTSGRGRRLVASSAAVALSVTLVLTGCSSSGSDDSKAATTTTESSAGATTTTAAGGGTTTTTTKAGTRSFDGTGSGATDDVTLRAGTYEITVELDKAGSWGLRSEGPRELPLAMKDPAVENKGGAVQAILPAGSYRFVLDVGDDTGWTVTVTRLRD